MTRHSGWQPNCTMIAVVHRSTGYGVPPYPPSDIVDQTGRSSTNRSARTFAQSYPRIVRFNIGNRSIPTPPGRKEWTIREDRIANTRPENTSAFTAHGATDRSSPAMY